MMKISTRYNLLYIILAIIFYNIRRIIKKLFDKFFNIGNTIFFTLLMFFGEFLIGLIISQYYKIILPKLHKISNKNSSKSIEKLQKDNIYKIYTLIFMIAYFDYLQYSMSVFYISKYKYIYGSLELRLYSIIIIFSSLIQYYILKLNILRHQFFSLLIIFICLIITIITEILIKRDYIFYSSYDFIILIFLFIIEFFILSLMWAIEQYMLIYNSLIPHELLFKEGIIGLIITFIGLINDTPIKKLKKVYNDAENGHFYLFIILCFLYAVLSGFYNIYKIHVISLYSPLQYP